MAKKKQPAIKINEDVGRADAEVPEGWRQRNYFKVSLQEDGENTRGQVEGNANPSKLIIQKKDHISWKNWPYANLQLQIPFFWVYYKNGLKGLTDSGVWRALESLLKFLLFSKGMFLEAEIGLLRLTLLKWWRAQIGPSCRNLTRVSKWWINSGWSSQPELCNLALWIVQAQIPARWGYGGVCGCHGSLCSVPEEAIPLRF